VIAHLAGASVSYGHISSLSGIESVVEEVEKIVLFERN